MACIGCECPGLPGTILLEGFEAMRPTEAFGLLEILSFSSYSMALNLSTKVLQYYDCFLPEKVETEENIS